MLPFIGKLLTSTLLRCCWFFNFAQFLILEDLLILDLALSGVKGLIEVSYKNQSSSLVEINGITWRGPHCHTWSVRYPSLDIMLQSFRVSILSVVPVLTLPSTIQYEVNS